MTGESRPPVDTGHDAFWREYLEAGHPRERAQRRFFILLPREPRCRVCAAPFAGIGAPIMRLIGKRRSDSNPNLCSTCFDFLRRHRGGAEIECTMLFADIRGSTALAETMSPGEFRSFLDRFYKTAAQIVFDHEGGVDKFVGDEVVAMFYPLLAGTDHARQAVAAARDILRATGHRGPGGPWAPVGAGVETGRAWVGAMGDDVHVELTAVGDAVNTAARLAAAAGAGEVLVTVATATAAGVESSGLERRTLDLKGKAEPVEVLVLA
jgi:adenylate cyclase